MVQLKEHEKEEPCQAGIQGVPQEPPVPEMVTSTPRPLRDRRQDTEFSKKGQWWMLQQNLTLSSHQLFPEDSSGSQGCYFKPWQHCNPYVCPQVSLKSVKINRHCEIETVERSPSSQLPIYPDKLYSAHSLPTLQPFCLVFFGFSSVSYHSFVLSQSQLCTLAVFIP